MTTNKDFDKEGLPVREGVYLVKGVMGSEEPEEIDVYRHPVKGLCCFTGDYGADASTIGVDDETDCHVSVQNTGLEFISRVRDLK